MKYRMLGKTGLRVSIVGVGTYQLGGEWGRSFSYAEVKAMLDTAREAGICLIDTAECYGDHLAEELIGRAIAGDRERWIVATKFGHQFRAPFGRKTDYSPDAVVRQLEASLRALRTDYVDLYQFHSSPTELLDTPGLWETLHRQVELGRVRALGVSIRDSCHVEQIKRAITLGVGAIQVAYNRLDRSAESILDLCRQEQLGVLARQPLADGLLGGRYRAGATFAADDVRSQWCTAKCKQRLEQVGRIQASELPAGVSMAQSSLAWCLRHPAVTCVIPGCRTIEHIESNASAAALVS